MSALVRGNRRKAVFAFKGLFTEGHLFVFASGSGFLSRISEVRGKSKLAENTPIFANKIAGHTRVQNRGLVGRSHFLTHFRVHLSIICGGLWNPQERRPFSIKRIVPPGGGFWGAALLVKLPIFNAHRSQFSMTIRTTFKVDISRLSRGGEG